MTKRSSAPPDSDDTLRDVPPSIVFGADASSAIPFEPARRQIIGSASGSTQSTVFISHSLHDPLHYEVVGAAESADSVPLVVRTTRATNDTALVTFLRRLPGEAPSISPRTAVNALEYWERLVESCRHAPLRLPIVMPTADDMVQFAWRTKEGIVTIDVDEGGEARWFSRTRATGEYWSEAIRIDDPLAPKLAAALLNSACDRPNRATAGV